MGAKVVRTRAAEVGVRLIATCTLGAAVVITRDADGILEIICWVGAKAVRVKLAVGIILMASTNTAGAAVLITKLATGTLDIIC